MKSGPLLFLATLLAMACAFTGLIVATEFQLGREVSHFQPNEDAGVLYPTLPPGAAHQGAEIYRANGCSTCHTRVVRGQGRDLPRWGKRLTVGADYLFEQPVMLGVQRLGPDLANVGARPMDANWHLLHLYSPGQTSPGSKMPPYRFLFEKRKILRSPSSDALKLSGKDEPPRGYEIVPKREAWMLVSFLLNQKFETDLFEAPMPKSAQPAPAAGETNAQANATNSVASSNSTSTASETNSQTPRK